VRNGGRRARERVVAAGVIAVVVRVDHGSDARAERSRLAVEHLAEPRDLRVDEQRLATADDDERVAARAEGDMRRRPERLPPERGLGGARPTQQATE
jgi:hypothetical protein